MDKLPEEILLKICTKLSVSDKFQLSIVSSRFRRLVIDSWQDYAVSLRWRKSNDNQTWLNICKQYFRCRKMWFSGKYYHCKVYYESSKYKRSQNILSSLTRCGNMVGVGTNQCLNCFHLSFNPETNNYQSLKVFMKDMEVAAHSLCLSSTHVCAIDDLTSELVVISFSNLQEYRSQLQFDIVCDFCHITESHIILLSDSGEIFLNAIGQNNVICIHNEKEEISCFFVHDDWHLFVAYWSGKLISFNIFNPNKPIIFMETNHVMYSIQLFGHFLYYGTADGGVGRILVSHNKSDYLKIVEFDQQHSGSVYCIATNKSILVSGGADSKVVFWNLHGTVLFIDHMSHVGVVRHIFLNEWIMITAGDAHVLIVWDPVLLAIKHVFHHNPLKIKYMIANETSVVYGSPDSNYVMFLSVSDD